MTPRTTTLHNTGRVLIGAAYKAPAPAHDADADRLQDALLGNRYAVWNMPSWMRKIWSWL